MLLPSGSTTYNLSGATKAKAFQFDRVVGGNVNQTQFFDDIRGEFLVMKVL